MTDQFTKWDFDYKNSEEFSNGSFIWQENVTNGINVSKHGMKLKIHNQIVPLTWSVMDHDGLDHGVEIWFRKRRH